MTSGCCDTPNIILTTDPFTTITDVITGLGKLLTPMCLCHRPTGVISLAGKVTVGLVESNGSLPLGL